MTVTVAKMRSLWAVACFFFRASVESVEFWRQVQRNAHAGRHTYVNVLNPNIFSLGKVRDGRFCVAVSRGS